MTNDETVRLYFAFHEMQILEDSFIGVHPVNENPIELFVFKLWKHVIRVPTVNRPVATSVAPQEHPEPYDIAPHGVPDAIGLDILVVFTAPGIDQMKLLRLVDLQYPS